MAKGYNLEQTGPQVQEAINKSLNLTTATQSKEGLMSAQDKQKLDSLDSELAGKVDKVQGKGLSTNDYDNTEKGKVASAYQKPVDGIPASDLAEGVIPDTSQFITKTVNDLTNYYLKTETYSRSETYTKSEVNALIALIKQFTYQVVSELPEASESTMYKLYLVPSADPQTQNVKDEYITVRSGSEGGYTYAWEQIGSTAINLSGYVTTEALNAALANYTTTANLTTLLAAKQDTISDLSAIRSGAAAGATSVQPAEFKELKDEVDTIGNGAYEEAWDGDSTPVVADIPAGVVVTYSSASYTGTLAASASTVDKIYLVSDGNGNYDRYTTVEANGAYSWKKVGSTAIPLSNYATKTQVNQLQQEVTELVDGRIVDLSQYEDVNGQVDSTTYAGVLPNFGHISIPVKPGQILVIKANSSANRSAEVAFVTATGARPDPIAFCAGSSRILITKAVECYGLIVPSDANYVAITSVYNGNDVRPDYVKVYDPLITDKVDKKAGVNLFDGKVIANTFMIGGELAASTSYFVTQLIPVKPNTKYSCSEEASVGFRTGAYLNKGMKILSYFDSASRTITTPADCYYLVVSIDNNEQSVAMVCESDTPLPFVPFDPIGGYDVTFVKKADFEELSKRVGGIDGLVYDSPVSLIGDGTFQQNIVIADGVATPGTGIRIVCGSSSAPTGQDPCIYFRSYDSNNSQLQNNAIRANEERTIMFAEGATKFDIRFFPNGAGTSTNGAEYSFANVFVKWTGSIDSRLKVLSEEVNNKESGLKREVDGIVFNDAISVTGDGTYQQNAVLAEGNAEPGKSILLSSGAMTAPIGDEPRIYFRSYDGNGNRIQNNSIGGNENRILTFAEGTVTFDIRFFPNGAGTSTEEGEYACENLMVRWTDSLEYRLNEMDSRERKHTVLWLGTSIPEGCRYPDGACERLGYACHNKSLGSSGICVRNTWNGNTGRDGKDLAETVAEKEARYRQYVTAGIITEATLDQYKSWSWENMIIPYINGDIANCDIVVFDHGINDRGTITTELETIDSANWDTDLPDSSYDRTKFQPAFVYLIKQIWKVNPAVKIVVCSYLENVSNLDIHSGKQIDEMLKAITSHYNFPYLNMCDYNDFTYARIPDSENYLSELNAEYGTHFTLERWESGYTGNNISRYQFYCPDGLHPHSDPTGRSYKVLEANVTKLLRDVF